MGPAPAVVTPAALTKTELELPSAPEQTPPTPSSIASPAARVEAEPPPASPPERPWWLIAGALVLAYALLSLYSASSPDARGLGAALSLGPVVLIAVFLVWRWIHPAAAIVMAGLLGAIIYRHWTALEQNYEWGDLVQQCGAYVLVAASFARSLYGDRVPLCTQLALKMHGTLTAAEIRYTRAATGAWAAFYMLLAIAILVLFFAAPLRIWSLFVNFATFGLMLIMGIADHALRQRLTPGRSEGGILTIIRRALIG